MLKRKLNANKIVFEKVDEKVDQKVDRKNKISKCLAKAHKIIIILT